MTSCWNRWHLDGLNFRLASFSFCSTRLRSLRSHGSRVVEISDVAHLVTSSSSVPLKTHRVGAAMHVKSGESSKRPPVGVVVMRRVFQLRCRPRHLTMAQNYVVRRQTPSCS
ncbi:hypothetical protein TNCV_2624891 [Trichonephila clavipes]|nr:hypothetical protein TNCV_2624891 [Trichonephila clavipes]